LEEIQGDVHEIFDRAVVKQPRVARLGFVWNVVRFFRIKNIRKVSSYHQNNSFTMFYNYLLIGFRNAVRNGLTSVINIGGLSVGIAGAVTIFVFADQWFHTDDFHENHDWIYQVTNIVNRDSALITLSDTPLLLGPMLQEEASSIDKMTRIEVGNGALRNGELVFFERLWFTDPSFFEIFTFSHVGVPADALKAPNSIVLTKPVAEKYFGDRDPVGQTVSMKFANNATSEFVVTAVADLPANNTLHFNIILPMQVFVNLKLKDQYDWSYLTDATFILLKPGQGIESLQPLMANYKKLQHEASPDWLIEEFKFYDMAALSKESGDIESYMIGSGQPQGIYTMSIIAFLLLLLACFNYTNISVATITTRLKEIGIRKVVGGRKSEIVQQFIAENALLCAFALVAGLIIAYLFFMPGLVSLIGYPIPFAFSSGKMMMSFFVGIFLFVIVISGVYPAFYVASFQPVQILKGKEKFGQRSAFSRTLLTMQFVLAFMTIVGCFLFIDNSLYLRNKDWGYDHDQNVVVPVNNREQYLKLRDKVAGRRDIVRFAGSAHHIGSNANRAVVDYAGAKFEMLQFEVGYDYLETMNLRLKEGRFFDRMMPGDSVASAVVNENFVKAMGWQSGVNQFFIHSGKQLTVIGVVRDFHHDDFYLGIRPALFTLTSEKDFRYLAMKVQQGNALGIEQELRTLWKEIGPDDPYRGILQDDVFYNFNRNNRNDTNIIASVATITLLLACLGLFGLVSYNITRRLKEFSIRKVFGAGTFHIFRLMNRDYAWILTIAFALGAPAGFLLMNQLIHSIYPDPQPAGPFPFAMAIGMMVVTVAVTIGSQIGRVTKENPAQTLRGE
jgi:ABC-type antimicrobial peptide transport system permease subunit